MSASSIVRGVCWVTGQTFPLRTAGKRGRPQEYLNADARLAECLRGKLARLLDSVPYTSEGVSATRGRLFTCNHLVRNPDSAAKLHGGTYKRSPVRHLSAKRHARGTALRGAEVRRCLVTGFELLTADKRVRLLRAEECEAYGLPLETVDRVRELAQRLSQFESVLTRLRFTDDAAGRMRSNIWGLANLVQKGA